MNRNMKIVICISILLLTMFCSSCLEEQDSKISSDADLGEQQTQVFPNTVYEDDVCKIVAEDFTDSDEPGYTYYLPLTFENKSSEPFIVGTFYGKMNDEEVGIICIPESGIAEYNYEFVVMPNEAITENFRVGYAQTSIRNINKVKTIEADFTLYKIGSYEEILNTGNVTINVK